MSVKHLMRAAAVAALVASLSSCGFRHRKYANPILNESEQPDKRLFDSAIKDLEKGRYEVARLQLSTLINTYDTSEYLAKAKLAIADSWYREGGTRGFSQAEAEYKDFILFYPNVEEAAESQYKICEIHYRQMEKPDRDTRQALAAERECRQLLVQFPNSVFTADAEQRLRNIQEVLAQHEFGVGDFYRNRGSFNAAANRLGAVADQYPLFSKADEALWGESLAYQRLGPQFRRQEGDALVRIVRDYPLSAYVEPAKRRLNQLEIPVPDPDPEALARMQYNLENIEKPGLFNRAFGFMRRGPATWQASRTGTPQMQPPVPTIPPLVPRPGANAGFQGDVTVAPVTDPAALEQNPDARQQPPPAPAKP
jgi:outer membrane protein assembly factor BamD